jgi:hypothetical protein
MSHPIRFGIQTGQQNVAWSALLDLWQKADGWAYEGASSVTLARLKPLPGGEGGDRPP